MYHKKPWHQQTIPTQNHKLKKIHPKRSHTQVQTHTVQPDYKWLKRATMLTGGVLGLHIIDFCLTHGKLLSGLTGGHYRVVTQMSKDVDEVLKQDSHATKTRLEALLAPPGLHALWLHRVAHQCYQWQIPVLPKVIANCSRILTGIEIHPGASLGQHVFFDHSGAIVGQTAQVGNHVKIIGRVCLGSNGKHGFLRHTIVKDGATLGMNATMLGRITIGEKATIGAGAVITRDVPDHATVVGMGSEARITSIAGKKFFSPMLLKDFKPHMIKKG